MRVLSSSSWLTLGLAAALWIGLADDATGQARWTVDPQSSIGWWQVDPHLNHLWATTCPQDPTWRPGEDRTAGWSYDPSLKLPRTGYSNVVDTTKMPLFPRLGNAEPVCTEAVSGAVTVQDPASWGGVTGTVLVQGEALQTGNTLRDAFMRRAVLETQRYQHIKFSIDSVGDVQVGDTLTGHFHGVLTLVGTDRAFDGPVRAWYEGENLRVQGRFKMPAASMVTEFGMSKYSLGLGVRTGIWRWVFVGVDLLLKPAGA